MHLAVDAAQRAIGIEDRRRVVIEAGRALLKQRCDEHNFILPGGGGEFFGSRPGNRLGQIEQGGILALAEILCLEKLGQADHVRALRAASATRSSALARLSAGSGPHDICTSATVNSLHFLGIRWLCHPERSEDLILRRTADRSLRSDDNL